MENIYCYCIKDTNGSYGGKLNIYSNNMDTGRGDYKWYYYSTTYPMTWFEEENEDIKINLENEISKLRELNLLAGFDLDWTVEVFDNRDAIMKLSLKSKDLGFRGSSSVIIKDIEKGCIGKHRKAVRDIYRKKYNAKEYIINELV